MSNYFTDNTDLIAQFQRLDLDRLIELRERGFTESTTYTWAPRDVADALDNYRRTLELVGDIAGNFIEPRAEDVDRVGSSLVDGEVSYAPGIAEELKRLRQADLMGVTLPRRFGGLNLPVTISAMIMEIVSRADASLMNVFGLQDIAETINKFASEEIKQAYLPRFASGEVTGSMALTESEAGSDLQNIQLKAHEGADGRWYLNGVKRFITNGCGEISLVLARSEEGSTDGRGLSLFLYERDEHMKIRRLEDKLGIHGSPTCELQFTDAPALLIGERRRGLTTYVMSLMFGARLAIAAQAQGISEAAYRAAYKYSGERVQFGVPIRDLTAVATMLADMKVLLETSRALLYEAATLVDLKEGLEHQLEEGAKTLPAEEVKALRAEIKKYTRYSTLFTPLAKAYCTEAANKIAYDSLQIHGGSGYMRDFAVERYLRDARITNIYEGTTQLQVVAARGGILGGVLSERFDDYEAWDLSHAAGLLQRVQEARTTYEAAIAHVHETNNIRFRDHHATALMEMGNQLVCAYLLLRDARNDARKLLMAEYFVDRATRRIMADSQLISEGRAESVDKLPFLGAD
ncbi:MAG: acyl-CoA dehydrogenase family protein [Thermoleophilia bacterium]|jgi:alkylation response protein AidB-like acyl-CoA dehydrogenase